MKAMLCCLVSAVHALMNKRLTLACAATAHERGCRVYKNYDPRATIIKQVAEDVFAIAGRDPLIDIAVELEKIARSDEYFISRKLYPNVDFYSG